MQYCPKCGNQVEENMTFCPRCGAPLKREAPVQAVAPAPAPRRNEKAEKGEKQEKKEPEKGEKHEKGQFGFMGFLIAGLVLILIGVVAYINATTTWLRGAVAGSAILLIIGVAIIVIGIYAATMARRRSPPTA